ncbi:MAG: signal peptidase I [Verrucomicrobiota bacterium]
MIEVRPPVVYVNGKPATGAAAFQKEFTRSDGYPGYTLVGSAEGTGVTKDPSRPEDPYDANNSQTYYVPADCYWAMGDNSPNSKDSRYWGGVPRQNLVGRGYFVFWPFTQRWGFIH